MKKKKLLSISLMCLFGMIVAGCNNVGPKSSTPASNPASSEQGGTSEAQPGSSEQGPASSQPGPSSSVAPQPVDPTGVTLDKTSANIIKGQTLQLTATVAPANADNKEITWSSDDEDIITVSKTGLVTAVEVGNAKVTAKIKNTNLKAECLISVIKEINSIAISNKSAFDGFIVDDYESLNITIDPADNATALLNAGVLHVTSSNTEVAAISGLTVTALKAGTATITAELFGKQDTLSLTVGEAIPGTPYDIDDALAKAFEECPKHIGTGKNGAITTTCFELKGVVLAVAPNGATGYNAIIDDGKGSVYLQVNRANGEDIPVAVGDYVQVTCKLTNYFGLYEGVSRKAATGDNASWIPSKDVIKLADPETPIVPTLNEPEAMTAEQYDAYYKSCAANGGTTATAFTNLKYVTLTLTYSETTNDNFKYCISNSYGVEIYNKDILDEPFEGQKSTVDLYLLGANTSKNKSNSIAVKQTPVAPTAVVINEEAQTIVHGFDLPLTYTTTPAGSYSRTVEWTSSDETAATVDENGVVHGVYVGNGTKATTVKVKLADGVEAQVAIDVFGEDVAATAVALATTSSVYIKETVKLTATPTPAMVSDIPVWSSDNEAIATVDQKGVVTGVSEGTANITVKYNDSASATCAVTVSWEHGVRNVDPLTVDEAITLTSALENKAKTTKPYFVKGYISEFLWDNFDDAAKNNATFWLASSTASQGFEVYGAIADKDLVKDNVKVGAEVLVGGLFTKYNTTLETSNGEATIYSATWEQHPATAINLNKETANMLVGDQLTLNVGFAPFYTTDDRSTVTWGSDNAAVATVSKGVVSALRPGSAKIVAKLGDLKAECVVTVGLPGAVLEKVAAYDFSTGNTSTSEYKNDDTGKAAMKARFASSVVSGEGLSDIVTGVSDLSKCYAGNNADTISNGMKFGTGSVAGAFTLALSKNISKVVVNVAGWTATDTLKVGDADAQTPGVAYSQANAFKSLSFNITASNSITFAFNLRGFIKGLEFYAEGEAPDPVAQPTGAYHGLAKMASGAFAPIDLTLTAGAAELAVNGDAVEVTAVNWDDKDTIELVTGGVYGTITAQFANKVFTITNVSGAARPMIDMSFAIQLSGNAQYIDCSVMDINAINATFLRRYDAGSGWVANTPDQGKMASVTVEGRQALKCNGYSGKIGLSLKNDFAQPIPGTVIKSIGVWIYNSGETPFDIVIYAYKGAGRTNAAQLNTLTVQPGWHFYQTGVVNGGSFKSTDSMYNFQIYYQGVTSCDPVFDDFCLYM